MRWSGDAYAQSNDWRRGSHNKHKCCKTIAAVVAGTVERIQSTKPCNLSQGLNCVITGDLCAFLEIEIQAVSHS